MRCLHLRRLATDGDWTFEIQQAHQLFRPKDQIVVNICNHEQMRIPEDLRGSLRDDEVNIQVCGQWSLRWKRFFVKNERLPMYNFPLTEYIYQYYRYDLHISTANGRGIGGMHATELNLLDIPVDNIQSISYCE